MKLGKCTGSTIDRNLNALLVTADIELAENEMRKVRKWYDLNCESLPAIARPYLRATAMFSLAGGGYVAALYEICSQEGGKNAAPLYPGDLVPENVRDRVARINWKSTVTAKEREEILNAEPAKKRAG